MTREQWEDLYRSAFPKVYRALALTLRDADRALDALHDAFAEGLRHAPDDLRNPEGWLYRVALRKARRGLLASVLPLRHEPTTEGSLAAVLDRDEVGRLMRGLTERQRAIVVAHYYLDQTQETIAAALGVSRGTVSATISKSLARMREAASHVV